MKNPYRSEFVIIISSITRINKIKKFALNRLKNIGLHCKIAYFMNGKMNYIQRRYTNKNVCNVQILFRNEEEYNMFIMNFDDVETFLRDCEKKFIYD